MSSIAAGGVQTERALRFRANVELWLATERHQLPLWLPVALGAGVAAWFALPWREQWEAAILLFLAVAAAGYAYGGLAGRALLIAGMLGAGGVGLAWHRGDGVAHVRLDREIRGAQVTGKIVEAQLLPGRERYRLIIAPDDAGLPRLVRISFRSPPPRTATSGAVIRMRATLRPPPGPSVPGGYDFGQRAWFDGLGATGFAVGTAEVVTVAPPPGGFRSGLDALRVKLTARMQQGVGGLSGGVAAALVTGDTGGITEEVNQAWRDSGIAHLLSISGLHIAVIVGGVMWLVRKLLCLSPWLALRYPVKTIAAGVAALAGISYTLLAGAQVPTVRSCIATLVVLVGLAVGRQAISLRTVAVAALLILAVRPEALSGPSFQLSFAAVVAIIAFYESKWGRAILTPADDERRTVRIARGFAGLFASGLLVEIALSPIALAHFGRTGLYGVLANLFAIPFSSFVVMPLTVMALLLDPFGLAAPVFAALRWSLDVLNGLAFMIASWSGAVAHTPLWPRAAYALMIAGGLWVALWRTNVRWAGVVPAVGGLLWALMTPPADLLVSPDGRHAGVATSPGVLAMLRPRAGGFILDMMGDASAAGRLVALDDVPQARCSPEACVVRLRRAGRDWTVLATRSRLWVDREMFAPACSGADIVISDRRLPDWCTPKWLKLDALALGKTGAVAIWLDGPTVRTVAEGQGDHPWTTQPAQSALAGSRSGQTGHRRSTARFDAPPTWDSD